MYQSLSEKARFIAESADTGKIISDEAVVEAIHLLSKASQAKKQCIDEINSAVGARATEAETISELIELLDTHQQKNTEKLTLTKEIFNTFCQLSSDDRAYIDELNEHKTKILKYSDDDILGLDYDTEVYPYELFVECVKEAKTDAALADTIANRFGYKLAFALAVNKIFIAEKDPKTDDADVKEPSNIDVKVADIEHDSDSASHIDSRDDKHQEDTAETHRSEQKKTFNFLNYGIELLDDSVFGELKVDSPKKTPKSASALIGDIYKKGGPGFRKLMSMIATLALNSFVFIPEISRQLIIYNGLDANEPEKAEAVLNDFDKVFEYLLRQGYFDRYYKDGDSDSDITLYSLTKAGISTLQKSTVQKELFGRTIKLDHSGTIENAADYTRHKLMAEKASELYKIDKIRSRVRGFKAVGGYAFCYIECEGEDKPECIIVPAIISKSDNFEKFAEFFEQLKAWVEDGTSLVILGDDLQTARKWVDFYKNELELDEVGQLQLLYGIFADEKIYTVNGESTTLPGYISTDLYEFLEQGSKSSISDSEVERFIDAQWEETRKKDNIKLKRLSSQSDARKLAKRGISARLDIMKEWLAQVDSDVSNVESNIVESMRSVKSRVDKLLKEFIEQADKYVDTIFREISAEQKNKSKAVKGNANTGRDTVVAGVNLLRYAISRIECILDGRGNAEAPWTYMPLLTTPHMQLDEDGYPDILPQLSEIRGYEPWRKMLIHITEPQLSYEEALALITEEDQGKPEWYGNYGAAILINRYLHETTGMPIEDYSSSCRGARMDAENEEDSFMSDIRLKYAYGQIDESTKETVFNILEDYREYFLDSNYYANFKALLRSLRKLTDDETAERRNIFETQMLELAEQEKLTEESAPMLRHIRAALDDDNFALAEDYINRLGKGEIDLSAEEQKVDIESDFHTIFLECYDEYYEACDRKQNRMDSLRNWGFRTLKTLTNRWSSPNESVKAERLLNNWIAGKGNFNTNSLITNLLNQIGFTVTKTERRSDIGSSEQYEVFRASITPLKSNLKDYAHPVRGEPHPFMLIRENAIVELDRKVWAAQLQTAFPVIELERTALVKKWVNEIEVALGEEYFDQVKYETGHITQFGEQIDDPFDVELGTLVRMMYLRKNKNKEQYLLYIPDENDRSRIHFLHQRRNELAHMVKCLPEHMDELL